jgi:hypothetical protein
VSIQVQSQSILGSNACNVLHIFHNF